MEKLSLMADNDFEYDVAFSFTQEDEALALRLADGIGAQGRRTFVYSRRQEEIAGRDGEQAFAEIFKSKARLVVVLLRATWSKTPFTRIEETAIRSRGFDHGYDFCLMVPLAGAKVADWFPRSRLWIGLERFGEASAIAVIEARCQEAGGEPVAPTLADRAAREQRDLEHAGRRERFLRGEGVQAANRAVEEFHVALQAGVEVLKANSPALNVSSRRSGHLIAIYADRPGLLVRYRRLYSNSLEGTELTTEAYGGAPPFPGTFNPMRSEVLRSITFVPDMDRSGELVWVSSGKKVQLGSVALADHILMWWLDRTRGDGPQMFFLRARPA